MRKFLFPIIGFIAFIATASSADASFCNPENPPASIYGGIYCDLGMGNQSTETEIYKAIAEQLQYEVNGKGVDLIKLIMDNGSDISCSKVAYFMKQNSLKPEDMPGDLKSACIITEEEVVPSGAESAKKWGDIIDNIYTAYNKERVLSYTKKSLEHEFKASEKYWDGELRDMGDAPFDLIVDLNLIEIVLFGSEAQWENDVWKWPVDEEDEGGDDAGAEPPAESQPAQPSEPPSGQPSDQTVTTEEVVTPGEEGECVPAEDPDADTGDHPGSDYTNPVCGNGTLEVLSGEECDDGNTNSGDGCNQYCMAEQTGATQVCQDTEAVTFSKPPSGQQSAPQTDTETDTEPDNPSDNEPECEPGTFPKKETTITGPPAETPEYPEAPQSENYPGPNVGGTMKEFPKSEKPPCKEGYSQVKVSAAGKETFYCMPDSFLCADPNDARDKLFPGWEDDEELAKIAESLEATFCVNVIKANRPEAPYGTNEGCIDCHITAMVQALDKALETNVSPLENTTGGFAISSRWGPKFSFNLITGIKASLKLATKPPNQTSVIEKIEADINKAIKDNELKTPAFAIEESMEEKAQKMQNEIEAQNLAVSSVIKNYRNASQAISDQESFDRIKTLFEQMASIFGGIQGEYAKIADTTALHKKPTCKF